MAHRISGGNRPQPAFRMASAGAASFAGPFPFAGAKGETRVATRNASAHTINTIAATKRY